MGRRASISAVVIWCAASGCQGEASSSVAGTSSSEDGARTTDAVGASTDATRGDDDRGETGSTAADGSSSDVTDDDSSGGVAPSGPRYDDVQQKSAHNAYQRHEALLDQLVYHRIRSLELDIHVGKSLAPTEDGEWYVYHTDVIDDDTSCVQLGDCLAELAAWNTVLAEHEITTVWIDLKDDWDDTHGPDELDARLRAVLGDALLGPAELRARCPTAPDVQTALRDDTCGWPELTALRGRVLVVLTGASATLRTYHDDDARPRAALVAPAITDAEQAVDWPGTAVFNFAAADVALAGEVAAAGHVVRVWGNEDPAAWQAAQDVGAHHIATDEVSQHEASWASTNDEDGWPFRCIDDCVPIGPEPGAVIGIDVDSGDIWDEADSGWFVHDDLADDPDHQWRAMISTANSHVEPFAKGCLMARASLDAAAPYFAVCRTADEQPLRVQWRADPGASSTAIEADIVAPGTIDPTSVAFVRLRVAQSGHCVAGDGSHDGESWVEIGAHCFDTALPLQGLAAAAHDAGPVRLLFVELRRDDGAARSTLDFAASAAMGDGSASVYDGVMP